MSDSRICLLNLDLANCAPLRIFAELLHQAGIEPVTKQEVREKYGIADRWTFRTIVVTYVHLRSDRRTIARVQARKPQSKRSACRHLVSNDTSTSNHICSFPRASHKSKD
jgi:hypothetical protein